MLVRCGAHVVTERSELLASAWGKLGCICGAANREFSVLHSSREGGC